MLMLDAKNKFLPEDELLKDLLSNSSFLDEQSTLDNAA